MLCLWSTRPGIGAALIRARDGGTASHCAIALPAGSVPGYELMGPLVIDAQPWQGVRPHLLGHWLGTHRLLCAYDVPLPEEGLGRQAAVGMIGWGYDWLRNAGYALWRDLGRSRKANCEELLLLAWLAGQRTISDRTGRISVRTLREIAHACGKPVPLDRIQAMAGVT
jgi:hypothetical protein